MGQDERQPSRQNRSVRRWAPRLWLGANFPTWMRLLARNHFAVELPYLYIAAADTMVAGVNSLLGGMQQLLYARRVAETEIEHAPVFVLGHWRSGTTLLHELLALDPEHTFPNTYACFAPHHFLLTEKFVTRWFGWLMPQQRPMDNMPTGWQRPQEDEFALCLLGQPSPYADIAFPNRIGRCAGDLDPEELTPEALESWKRALVRFLKQVTFRDPRRIVLKSPPHTCRVRTLVDLFPKAYFVNIVRDPYVLFASTMHLWNAFHHAHGLQRPRGEHLQQYVLATFSAMHRKLEAARRFVPPSQFYDMRYEDLVADPEREIRGLYAHFGWDFQRVRPALEEHLSATAGYQTNRYELSAEQRAEVARCWAPYFQRYGYQVEDEVSARAWEASA